ncbi:hypothetical protein [Desulfobulbus sp.]|uniref:hypothetical protein n=1 Tax=Desulfobulbus sp. TaxID=895 RepID=UPI0027B9C797|nr:hypothetical protein [Desulfobulbus sp.]
MKRKISGFKTRGILRHDTDAGGWRDLDNINVAETMQRVAELIAAEKGISPALKDNSTANETYSAPASSICVHCSGVSLGSSSRGGASALNQRRALDEPNGRYNYLKHCCSPPVV